MVRVVPLAILLFATVGAPVRAEERLVDGRPCNSFCRNWLGLDADQPDARAVQPNVTTSSAADVSPAAVEDDEPAPRHRAFAARSRPHFIRSAGRRPEPAGPAIPQPPRPDRLPPAPVIAATPLTVDTAAAARPRPVRLAGRRRESVGAAAERPVPETPRADGPPAVPVDAATSPKTDAGLAATRAPEPAPPARDPIVAARPRPKPMQLASRAPEPAAVAAPPPPDPLQPARPTLAVTPEVPRIEGRGGYPSGIPLADTAAITAAEPKPGPNPSAASWEQTALRIFEGADEPVPAVTPQPEARRGRSRRR